ncbi:MAG: hypothetical protein H0X16_02870 [Chloroflexi bacterium]|nr:hypothetical protein [Chloroflexota bacterium]
MPALETLPGLRIVASPEALDAAPWSAGTVVLRFAPDDAFAIGATAVDIADDHAIVAEESGFVGRWLTREELDDRLVTHIEWPLPTALPALAQGLIAGVPAKLWLTTDRVLLLCAAAYAAELADRLG